MAMLNNQRVIRNCDLGLSEIGGTPRYVGLVMHSGESNDGKSRFIQGYGTQK